MNDDLEVDRKGRKGQLRSTSSWRTYIFVWISIYYIVSVVFIYISNICDGSGVIFYLQFLTLIYILFWRCADEEFDDGGDEISDYGDGYGDDLGTAKYGHSDYDKKVGGGRVDSWSGGYKYDNDGHSDYDKKVGGGRVDSWSGGYKYDNDEHPDYDKKVGGGRVDSWHEYDNDGHPDYDKKDGGYGDGLEIDEYGHDDYGGYEYDNDGHDDYGGYGYDNANDGGGRILGNIIQRNGDIVEVPNIIQGNGGIAEVGHIIKGNGDIVEVPNIIQGNGGIAEDGGYGDHLGINEYGHDDYDGYEYDNANDGRGRILRNIIKGNGDIVEVPNIIQGNGGIVEYGGDGDHFGIDEYGHDDYDGYEYDNANDGGGRILGNIIKGNGDIVEVPNIIKENGDIVEVGHIIKLNGGIVEVPNIIRGNGGIIDSVSKYDQHGATGYNDGVDGIGDNAGQYLISPT